MAQDVEGKMSDVGILQQAVVVILEGFLLKVVTELVDNDESLVGVLIDNLSENNDVTKNTESKLR